MSYRGILLCLLFPLAMLIAAEMPYQGEFPYLSELPYDSDMPYQAEMPYGPTAPLSEAVYAYVLEGQHFNVDTNGVSDCSADEDTTSPNDIASTINGTPNCDYTGGTGTPGPPEGAQWAKLAGLGDAATTSLYWSWGGSALTHNGLLISFDFEIETEGDTLGYARFYNSTFFGSPTNAHPKLLLENSAHNGSRDWRMTCATGVSFTTAGVGWSEDTTYKIEAEYYWTKGPGGCTGLADGCTKCGCMRVNDVQIGSCDATTQTALGVNGHMLESLINDHDLLFDRAYVCRIDPDNDDGRASPSLYPVDTRCGDDALP